MRWTHFSSLACSFASLNEKGKTHKADLQIDVEAHYHRNVRSTPVSRYSPVASRTPAKFRFRPHWCARKRPMLFNSRVFLFVFLPVAYFVFWRLKSRQARYIWLTISGYSFYSFWNYKFCALMAFSTLVSYVAGIGFLRFQDAVHRKLCLIVPIVIDLSLLGFFKYFK